MSGWPWLTIGIIAACTLMQVYSSVVQPSEAELLQIAQQLSEAQSEEEAAAIESQVVARMPILRWGYRTGSGLHRNLFLSAFVHDGWIHLVGNMIFLWLAGSVLEDRWGRVRYALFYAAAAVASAVVFSRFYHGPPTVLVGASGAISACLGGFLILNHDANIELWYVFWIGWIRTGTFRMRAYLALPLWLAEQFLWAFIEGHGMSTGTAYTAHIGGFAFGCAAALVARSFAGAGATQGAHRPADQDAGDQADAVAQIEARYQRCMEALTNGDSVALDANAARAIIDLARRGDHARVLKLYKLIAERAPNTALTDRALADAAAAADQESQASAYVAIAGRLLAQHAGSRLLPPVLWRVAELQRDGGRPDLAAQTLAQLAARFPSDPHGRRAGEALAQRSGG